jgi:hypothetical protein
VRSDCHGHVWCCCPGWGYHQGNLRVRVGKVLARDAVGGTCVDTLQLRVVCLARHRQGLTSQMWRDIQYIIRNCGSQDANSYYDDPDAEFTVYEGLIMCQAWASASGVAPSDDMISSRAALSAYLCGDGGDDPGQLEAKMDAYCCPPPAACECLPTTEGHDGCVPDGYGNGYCTVDPSSCPGHTIFNGQPYVYCNPYKAYASNGTCLHAQCEGMAQCCTTFGNRPRLPLIERSARTKANPNANPHPLIRPLPSAA